MPAIFDMGFKILRPAKKHSHKKYAAFHDIGVFQALTGKFYRIQQAGFKSLIILP